MTLVAHRLSLGGSGRHFRHWMPQAAIWANLSGLGLKKYASNPVLAKGTAAQWDDFGVRELRPVIDENGIVVRESDGIWAYYGGRGDSAGVMDIGLAKSTTNGLSWTRYGSNPVLTQAGAGWYQTGIAQPSIVKLTTGTRVMAAQGLNGTTYSLGVLTSTDGLSWADQGQKLTLGQFSHGVNTITLMGVPSMIKRESGTWVMLLEGLTDEASPAWHIYGATATDPTATWTVMNSGEPIFTHTGAGWEAGGVANPQLIEATPGVFVMAYNALASGVDGWDIGFAYTTDFSSWTRFTGNPVISPVVAWEGSHTETCFLWKDPNDDRVKLFYQGNDPVTGAQEIGFAST